MTVRWHPSAEAELNDVAAFYLARDLPDVAAAFIDEAQRVAELVAKAPEAGALLRDGVRRWRLHGYPYAIVYRENADHVRILAVAGDRQRPFYWRDRA
ncbi:MAG: type II toxin-antitoxin system RelE/ParE family toxin [Polyangiaceae bacterium]